MAELGIRFPGSGAGTLCCSKNHTIVSLGYENMRGGDHANRPARPGDEKREDRIDA
jgi:hypothetical protein